MARHDSAIHRCRGCGGWLYGRQTCRTCDLTTAEPNTWSTA